VHTYAAPGRPEGGIDAAPTPVLYYLAMDGSATPTRRTARSHRRARITVLPAFDPVATLAAWRAAEAAQRAKRLSLISTGEPIPVLGVESLSEVSRRSQYSLSHISKIFTGDRMPSLQCALRIAKGLSITVEVLCDYLEIRIEDLYRSKEGRNRGEEVQG
jgi:hypothetical protein